MNTINKKIFTAIALLTAVFGLVTGCDDKEGFQDVSVTAVEQFYEPTNERYVVLKSDASMYFEWEAARAADNSIVYYDVLFDKANGDFSKPIYVQASDNGGVSSGATITHKSLNKIAGLAGIDFAAEGDIKWTVRSSRGLNFVKSEQSRTLTVVRINSVEELTGPLYMAGGASEEGQQFKSTGATTYEIYTKIEAGQPYYFSSTTGGAERKFVINTEDGSFRETSATPETTVDETGIYRITLDFEAAAAKLEKIDKLELVVSWTQRKTEFTYVSKGLWELKDYNVQLTSTSWGFDERYKIVFTIDGEEEHWGQLGPFSDPRPALANAAYRNMKPTEGGQWGGQQFKFPNELADGADLDRFTTDVTVSMTADKNYTHDYTNIRG
jgi:starch-binding outer membrane protein SusE/F